MLKIFRKAIGGGGTSNSSSTNTNTNSVSSLTPSNSQSTIQTNATTVITNNNNNNNNSNSNIIKVSSPVSSKNNVFTIKRDSKGKNSSQYLSFSLSFFLIWSIKIYKII